MGCFNSFKQSYFVLFCRQLFDIGNSSGSLLIEAITLFRTFQKLSAPSDFTNKFPPEFMEMFSWATNLINIISASVQTNPFSNYELFILFVFIFPLSILTFTSTITMGIYYFLVILFLGFFLWLGIGVFYLQKAFTLGLVFIIIPGICILLGIILLIKFWYNYASDVKKNQIFYSDGKKRNFYQYIILYLEGYIIKEKYEFLREKDCFIHIITVNNTDAANHDEIDSNLNETNVELNEINETNSTINETDINTKTETNTDLNDINEDNTNVDIINNSNLTDSAQSETSYSDKFDINGFEKHVFFYSSVISALFFYSMMIPILLLRWKLAITVTVIVLAIIFIVILIEFVLGRCIHIDSKKIQKKMSAFLLNFLILFVIPSTENFFELIDDNMYGSNWFIICSYIYNSCILPLALILTMVLSKHNEIKDKYRSKYTIYYYFELLDMICQICYSIAAAFNSLWACLAIEMFWFVIIIVVRPFNSYSEHFLSAGNSLILIISNGVLLYFDTSKQFNITLSIAFVVIACCPAIVSLYVFFIFDFDVTVRNSEDEKDEDSPVLYLVATCLSPISWFFFGMNLFHLINTFG